MSSSSSVLENVCGSEGEIGECSVKKEEKETGGSKDEESKDESAGLTSKTEEQMKTRSLPDIFASSENSKLKIETYFNKWRMSIMCKKTRGPKGEWTQKLTFPVTLEKMAEILQHRNSVLHDSFLMGYNWRNRNKSHPY
jgi:hypothetical protein